jgi:hypothetical protein
MQLSIKRVLDKRASILTRGLLNETKLRLLLGQLNTKKSRAHRRLSGLLSRFKLTQQMCKDDARGVTAPIANRKRDKALAELNRLVHRYTMRPVCKFSQNYGLIVAYHHTAPRLAQVTEAEAASLIVELAMAGLFERLRTCTCGKWFFGRTSTQRFCSPTCRIRHFKSSEEWKAHRRKYMRGYYRLQQSGRVK